MYTDFQEIKVQQAGGSGGGAPGAPGKGVTVLLQDDLADSCQVGGACTQRGGARRW